MENVKWLHRIGSRDIKSHSKKPVNIQGLNQSTNEAMTCEREKAPQIAKLNASPDVFHDALWTGSCGEKLGVWNLTNQFLTIICTSFFND